METHTYNGRVYRLDKLREQKINYEIKRVRGHDVLYIIPKTRKYKVDTTTAQNYLNQVRGAVYFEERKEEPPFEEKKDEQQFEEKVRERKERKERPNAVCELRNQTR